eukprot:2926617-Prymnesium_polylepis.1
MYASVCKHAERESTSKVVIAVGDNGGWFRRVSEVGRAHLRRRVHGLRLEQVSDQASPTSLMISTVGRAATRCSASASCVERATRAHRVDSARRTPARPTAAQGRHVWPNLKAVCPLSVHAGHATRRHARPVHGRSTKRVPPD